MPQEDGPLSILSGGGLLRFVPAAKSCTPVVTPVRGLCNIALRMVHLHVALIAHPASGVARTAQSGQRWIRSNRSRLGGLMSSSERSASSRIPSWWLTKLQSALKNTQLSQSEIARRASNVIQREPPWSREVITRFRDGSSRSPELVQALSVVLGIPLPFWVAESAIEAEAFATTARTLRGSPDDRADIERRVADEIARRRDEIAERVERHVELEIARARALTSEQLAVADRVALRELEQARLDERAAKRVSSVKHGERAHSERDGRTGARGDHAD